jgi:hypothetical protein
MESHPRSHFLYVVACLGVWSLCWFALLLVGIFLVFCFHWAILFAVALCIFFINMFVFLPLAFSFRCRHCDGFVLMQGWRTLQPARKRVLAALGLASWVAVCSTSSFITNSLVCTAQSDASSRSTQTVPTAWPGTMTNSQHAYEIRPRKGRRGVDLISASYMPKDSAQFSPCSVLIAFLSQQQEIDCNMQSNSR